MTKNDNEEMERIVKVILDDHLKDLDHNIKTSWNFDTDQIIPILLKQIYESQKTLKRSQDNLNVLTGVLVVFTIVLAILTALLYFKS